MDWKRVILAVGVLAAGQVLGKITIAENAMATVRPGIVNLPVTFTIVATSSGGTKPIFVWEFGDGEIAFGNTVSHTFAKTGVYNVIVTLSDSTGDAARDYVSMPVIANEQFVLIGYSKGGGDMSLDGEEGTDSMTLTGVVLNVLPDSDPSGQTATFSFGGIVSTFNLSSKGSGKSSDGNASLSIKYPKKGTGQMTFTVILKKQTHYPTFKASGYVEQAAGSLLANQAGIETALFYGKTQLVGKVFLNVTLPKVTGSKSIQERGGRKKRRGKTKVSPSHEHPDS